MRGNPWQGTVSGNTVKLTVTTASFFKGANVIDQQCTGTFSADCSVIDWGPPNSPLNSLSRAASLAYWRLYMVNTRTTAEYH